MKHILAFLTILALPLAAQEKVSEREAMTGAQINGATDLIGIADMSVPKSKKITVNELWNFYKAGASFSGTTTVNSLYAADVSTTSFAATGSVTVPNGSFALSKLSQSGAFSKQVPIWNGSAWAAGAVSYNDLADVPEMPGGGTWGGITGTLSSQTDLQNALNLKVNTSDLSTTGGANKVALFNGTGQLKLGPTNATGSNPGGGLRIPAFQRMEWENSDGVTGANLYLFAEHSGGSELLFTAPRFCFYWDDGFQLGQAGTARTGQYLYMHSLGASNVGDPFRESTPVFFSGTYWDGSASQSCDIGMQWIPSGNRAGELAFGISNGTFSNTSSGKVKSIAGVVNPFSITEGGPKIGSGKTLTFGDGSTLSSAPNLQARTGNITLIGGSKTVADTSVTNKTNVILTRRSSGGTLGDLTYSTTPGASFTVTSSSGTDTSRLTYLLVEDTVAANAPAISGTNAVGDTLTVSSGGGSGTYQWYSNGSAVSGQTGSTYVVRHQDIGLPITCREDGVASNVITAWHPDDESGYFADFRADSGLYQSVGGSSATVHGDPVGEWRDQSGYGRHISQATAGKRPQLDLTTHAGYPFLDFDATDDSLQTLVSISRPHTAFVVGESKTVNANKRMFTTSDSGARMMFEQTSSTQIKNYGAICGSGQMPLNERHLVTGRTTATLNAVRVDANTEVTATETTGNGAGIYVSQSSGGGGADCRVYAVLIYTADLDSSAQARVRSYLKAKWGTP